MKLKRKGEIFMAKHRIAVATDGEGGLKDVVSDVFGRAKTFTIVDAENEKIIGVKVLKNPAISYAHGAGPIAIKSLVDDGVGLVIAYELGIGASEILKQHNISYTQTKPGTNVEKIIKKTLRLHKK